MALAKPTCAPPLSVANEVPAHVCAPEVLIVCTTLLLASVDQL